MKSKMKKSGGKGFSPDTGGKGMAGFSGAASAQPGKVSSGGRAGNTRFAPDTGGKAMAGYTGSTPQKPA